MNLKDTLSRHILLFLVISLISGTASASAFTCETYIKNIFSQSAHSNLTLVTKSSSACLNQTEVGKYQNSIVNKDLVSAMLGNSAQVCHQQKKHKYAHELLKQAIVSAEKANNPSLSFCWFTKSAEFHESLGNFERSKSLREMADSFSSNQNDLFSNNKIRANSSSIQHNNSNRLRLLMDELAALPRSSGQTLRKANEIQDLIERKKVIDINNYFEEDCVNQSAAKNYSVDIGVAVLYTIFMPDDSLRLLLRTSNSVTTIISPLSRRELNQYVLKIISHTNDKQQDDDKEESLKLLSSELYTYLLKPFSSALKNTKNLVIIPEGSLNMLQWSALFDKPAGQYVVNKEYSISMAPGLSLIIPKKVTKFKNALFAGYAKEGGEGDISDNVLKEWDLLIDYSGKSINTLLSGGSKTKKKNSTNQRNEFNERNLRWLLSSSRHSTIHLSTHADFQKDKDNTKTGVLLGNDKILSFNKLGRLFKSAALNKGGIDLLYLGACKTAANSITETGEAYDWKDSLGLTGIAAQSGVSSVIGNLIEADSEASSILTKQFYQNLKGTSNTAKSLQLAQQYLLKNHKTEFGHPRFWAPAILVGDWN